MYVNIRGLKSKYESFLTKVQEVEPTIICITETHLIEKEEFKIEGYADPWRSDKDNLAGGLMIVVKKGLENVCIKVEDKKEVGECMWMTIDNNKVKIRLGLIYAPQESRTNKKKLKPMYEAIEEQILYAKEKQQNLLILGDFNCKIGDIIKGNRKDVTQGGKMLLKMTDVHNLTILNKTDKCQGLWTRTEGKYKSVIDYMIVDDESEKTVEWMRIDEDKDLAPRNIDGGFSDHNVITAGFNWLVNEEVPKGNVKITTKKAFAQIGKALQEEKISEVFKEDADFQTCYDKWKTKVEQIEEKYKVKVKNKNPRRSIRNLVKQKKKIKQQMKKVTKFRRKMLTRQVKEIDRKIQEESNTQYRNKIIKVVEDLRSKKGINGPNVWEVLKKVRRKKNNPPTAIKDKKGHLLEEKEEIKSRYIEHFCEILKPTEARDAEEKTQEENINAIFENIVKIAHQHKKAVTTKEEVEQAVKELKKNKCRDEYGWKNELLIEGNQEMILSLTLLFKKMEEVILSPKQWRQVLIQTIPKKGSCLEMNNKRGLFITEIVSKVYEKVLKNRNSVYLRDYVSPFQTGGTKSRATVDNKIILSEIIRRNRKMGVKTYVVFGDAVKCFDKLWLKDALVELYKAGCSPSDVVMMHEMNKDTEITIVTPVGKTERIKVGEIVKQGTVLGPTLCCVETDQINNIGEDQTRPLGNEIVGILIFVDDVMSAGTAEVARKCIRNLREMEKLKKFTFGLKKTNYMVIETGKEPKESIEEDVKEGRVSECFEYEYLGFWVNQDGNCMLQIERKAKKIKGEIAAIKSLASYRNVGPTYLNVRLMLYECCILPSLLYDLEGWNRLSKNEIKKLESIQLKSLCSLIGLPKSTPYIGLLSEVGIWTIEERMKYRKLMLYHNLINSDDKRLARNIVLGQREEGEKDSFYDTVKEMASSLSINVECIDSMKKSELKKKIKTQIEKKMVDKVNSQLHMKKLRFIRRQSNFNRNEYVVEMDASSAIQVMKTRLNMLPIYGNYKHDLSIPRSCPLCKGEDDTTEHMILCPEVENDNITPEDLTSQENTELWSQINELIKHNVEKRKVKGGKISKNWNI